jgi:hypothetical protein
VIRGSELRDWGMQRIGVRHADTCRLRLPCPLVALLLPFLLLTIFLALTIGDTPPVDIR